MNKKEDTNAVELDLLKLLQYYLKKWWIILLCGLVLAVGMLMYTKKFVTPMYSASVSIYVNNWVYNRDPGMEEPLPAIQGISGGNLATAQRLVSTYVNIIRSNTVLEKVVEAGNLPYTPGQLRGMMYAAQIGDTEMFSVAISHSDAEMAAHIANTIAEVAPGMISQYVEGSSTKIIDFAEVPQRPYTPDYRKNTSRGALIGIAVALVALTLRFLFDMRIRDEGDIDQYFDIPLLGSIPSFEQTGDKHHRGKKSKKSEYGLYESKAEEEH